MYCPDPLYKFVGTLEAAKAILKGSIKFCSISELNDPTELLPWFDESQLRDSLDVLRRGPITQGHVKDLQCQHSVLLKICPELVYRNPPVTIEDVKKTLDDGSYDDMPGLRNFLAGIVDCMRQRVGILSLSENWNNLALWAHYANLAEGYCMGFRQLDWAFPGDETSVLNQPLPVTYGSPRKTVTFEPGSHRNVFLSKLDDWAYEKEWRVARALSDCEQITGNLWVHEIGQDHIRDVICGWKVPETAVLELKKHVASIGTSATLWRTEIDSTGILIRRPETS